MRHIRHTRHKRHTRHCGKCAWLSWPRGNAYLYDNDNPSIAAPISQKELNMTELDHLTAIIRDEEHGAAANAIQRRVAAIESLPDGPLRARFCAAAHLTGGYQMMQILEGDAATVRQLRRLADMIECVSDARH